MMLSFVIDLLQWRLIQPLCSYAVSGTGSLISQAAYTFNLAFGNEFLGYINLSFALKSDANTSHVRPGEKFVRMLLCLS